MNAFGTADRYWQTIRHLKPGQITGRIRYRVFKPQPDLSPEPRVRGRVGQWQVPASRPASMTGPGRFMFLNEDGSLDNDGWDNPQRDKLWTYNQHYFDDLNADGSGGRTKWHRQLMANWIGSNPPGIGTGWEPYPTSLRIVNWIKWILAGNQPEGEVLSSLAIQARWLAKRLEWHLLGNHLLANAKALVFAGLFFDGVEAREWRETGLKILEREIREQILPDGGHFELSPMYHALVLEDFLDLLNLTRAFPGVETGQVAEAIRDRIPSMLGWLSTMSHPDGKISFFNDAAFGIACENRSLQECAQRLGIAAIAPSQPGQTHLADSGYVRLQNRGAAVIADFARIGPDYLPGHAHADTLSLEASLFGHRVLVNSGTSLYGTGPERLRQRGTLAHNTVTIGNKNSSEVWSGFRVARRANVFDVTCGSQNGTFSAAASHDGYMRLKGRPVHRRTVSLTEQHLKISDSMASTGHEAVARFHIHPGVAVERTSDVSGKFRLPSGRSVDWQVEGGEPSVEPTTWHPEFGKSIVTKCLSIPVRDGQSTLNIRWDQDMHILLLSDNFPPETNAPANRGFEHAKAWVAAGHRVTVITCAPNFPQGKVYEGYRNSLWQKEDMDGIEVIRVWTYMTRNEGFARRILDFVSYMVTAFIASFFVRRIDVIIGTSPQFFTACAAWAVSLFRRRPWVFELRDIWPESIRAVSGMKNSRVLDLLEKLELFLYRKADAIVAVTPSFKRNLIERGVDEGKISVATNGVDLSRFARQPRDQELEQRLNLKGKFVAGYIGTHGMAHHLETLVDAAQMLQSHPEGRDIRFLLVGDGASKSGIQARARELGLTNMVFVDPVSREEVSRYWSLLDASIVHLKDTPLFSTVIPSKIFECMAMGIPILHGVRGDSAQIIQDSGAGLLFEPENPTELATGILELAEDAPLRASMANNAVAAAPNFDRIVLATQMLKVLQTLKPA